VHSAHPNNKALPIEPLRAPETLWKELEPHVQERALRILSDLCYAYITTAEVDSSLGNNDSELDQGSTSALQAI